MNQAVAGSGVAVALPRSRAADFVELTKPRVVLMVLFTMLAGYYLGLGSALPSAAALLHALLGMALAAGGTLALNMVLERDLDARMERTRRRPLPEGRLQAGEAMLFGCGLTGAGIIYLGLTVNLLCAVVASATAVGYLCVYTPLKRRSALCSLVGAIPGALPPVAGWAAARGTLDPGAWILFSILFLWQMPHSLAIARLYRDDYTRAGVAVLPVVDRHGRSTDRLILSHALALLAVGLLPTLAGMAGPVYFVAALVLGLGQLVFAVRLCLERSDAAARRLLHATLIYLPALLAVMTLDKAGM